MRKNFFGFLWESFRKIRGVPGVLLALVLAVVLWLFSPDSIITSKIVLPIGLVLILVMLTFLDTAYEIYKSKKHFLPKVVYGKEFKSPESKLLCLLESSELFSHDSLISFYYDEGYEQLIGIGRVLNIQENGKIQVILTHPISGYEEIIRRLSNCESAILNKTIVKPNVPMSIISEMLSKGE